MAHMRQSRQRRIVRAGAVFVLLIVMLPSVAYVGHWDPFGVRPTQAHSLHHGPVDNQDHSAHCHAGPSTCTGPQATVGSWWIGDDPNPIASTGPTFEIAAGDNNLVIEGFADRTVPPPRFA